MYACRLYTDNEVYNQFKLCVNDASHHDATHHVAEKDHQATEVSTSRQGPEWTAKKKINCC